MTYETDAEIKALTARFLDRTLPKQDWTHTAHFAVALCLLADDSIDAFAVMPSEIRAYNEATGVKNTDQEGYHETITRASLLAARDILTSMVRSPSLVVALKTIINGSYGRSDWLLTHWSRDRLFSIEARRNWVAPDLEPLPFEIQSK